MVEIWISLACFHTGCLAIHIIIQLYALSSLSNVAVKKKEPKSLVRIVLANHRIFARTDPHRNSWIQSRAIEKEAMNFASTASMVGSKTMVVCYIKGGVITQGMSIQLRLRIVLARVVARPGHYKL